MKPVVRDWWSWELRFAKLCLWAIQVVCRHKDESLATMIHDVAGLYQRLPQDGWMPPPDWDCYQTRDSMKG